MKPEKFLIAIFFILLVNFSFAAAPVADAGPDRGALVNTEITIEGTCIDPDPTGTDDGRLYECDWELITGWSYCDIIDEHRTVVEDNYNTASITLECGLPGWADSRSYKLRLTATDYVGNNDSDEMWLIVSRPEEEFECDFSSFSPTIDFTESVPDFSTPQGCSEGSCSTQAVLINSGATVSNFGFGLHNSSSGQYNAAVKIEIRNAADELVDEYTNDLGSGTLASSVLLSFDASKYAAEQHYFINVYYSPCSTIDAGSIDTAYQEYYNAPRNWQLVKTQEVLIVPETVRFQCWNFSQNYNFGFTQDSAFDSDLSSYMTAKGNVMRFYNFAQFNAKCVNGVPGMFYPMFKADVIDAETGDTVGTYDNNPDGTLALESSFVVPFNSKGRYIVKLYIKTCPPEGISEEGQHSWDAFLREYIQILQSWELIGTYSVISLDPADMQANVSGNNTEFHFPPYEQTYIVNMNWDFYNSSTFQYFGISLINAEFTQSPPPPLGPTTTSTYPTLDAGEGAIIIAETSIPLQTTEITKQFTARLTFDDKWDLDTIPEKIVEATATLALFPPPADVLAVTKIVILPSNVLQKPNVETFDVEVTLKNFSKALVSPTVALRFQDALTNQILSIPAATQSGNIMPESTRTYYFTGIALRDEPQFETGKNYWVKAEVTNPGVEDIIVNDEKKEILSVIMPQQSANVPEMHPLAALLVGLIALILLKGKAVPKSN